jgi:DNA-binding transcriptional regulator GbsR (MarR family)
LAKRGPELIDPRLATAIEHPLRIEIMGILLRGPSSAARIQRELDNVSLNLVAHHMKVLKDLDCIELQETVARRGAREHIFRIATPAIVSDEEFTALTPKRRMRMTASILRAISQDLSASLSTGKFDSRRDTHTSRSPLVLDDEAGAELTDLLERTLAEVLEIGARSRRRLEASDEEPVPTTVAILKFPTD